MVAEQLDIYIGQTKILTQYVHSKTIYTLTGGQQGGGGGRGEASPALLENRKRCPDFGRWLFQWLSMIVSIFALKLSIQNVILRVSWRKISKMLPCRVSFSCVFAKFLKGLSNYSSSTNHI